jgi:site-specific DNA recombinase
MKRRASKATTAATAATATRRCAIYTRKSTTAGLEQEFNSLDAQRDECLKYMRTQPGWIVVETAYDDGGFTGANIDRPGFQRLLADIDAGLVDIVLVYKIDRLSRSLLDFAKVMDVFNQAGVAFVSVTQKFSTADAMGGLMLNVLMSFAQFERQMIGERTRDKIQAARRRGRWTGGKVPLGYDVVDRKLVVNDLEALVVREVFGLYQQHRSLLAVMRQLEERKRRTKRVVGRDGVTKEGEVWDKDVILRILRNPIYAGLVPSGDERFPGEHTALMERGAFESVQHLLDERAEAMTLGSGDHAPEQRGVYLLKGILECGCGASMTPASTRKGRYRYYRCVRKDKRGARACTGKPLPAAEIEELVVARVRVVAGDPGLVSKVAIRLRGDFVELQSALKLERVRLPMQIAAISDEIAKLLLQAKSLPETAARLAEDQTQKLGNELAGLERRLAEVERRLARLREAEVESTWVAKALADFDRIWDAMTIDNQVRLLRAVFDRVVVKAAAGKVEIHLAAGVKTATKANCD